MISRRFRNGRDVMIGGQSRPDGPTKDDEVVSNFVGDALHHAPVFEVSSLVEDTLNHSTSLGHEARLPFPITVFEFETGPYRYPMYQIGNRVHELIDVVRVALVAYSLTDTVLVAYIVIDFERYLYPKQNAQYCDIVGIGMRGRRMDLNRSAEQFGMRLEIGHPDIGLGADDEMHWGFIPIGAGILTSSVPEFGPAGVVDVFQCWMSPLKYTLAMLECKNVTSERVLPTRQQRRMYERRGEPIPNEHRIIVKVPGKGTHTLAGPRRPGEAQIPAHMVRGHFAEYTEERPLFGKYSGRFWIPAHVRGVGDAQPREYVVKPSGVIT
jgi:hypothetical protein